MNNMIGDREGEACFKMDVTLILNQDRYFEIKENAQRFGVRGLGALSMNFFQMTDFPADIYSSKTSIFTERSVAYAEP
jgi:hypothetical protein